MIKQKAQALVELAVFGTVLLLCLAMFIQYGMHANYQQNAQMEGFRRAMKIAFYRTGPSSSASLQVTKDKPMPDPRDPWGFGERVTVGGGGSVTWDTNLQGSYIENFGDTPDPKDLPRTITEINETLRISDSEIKDGNIMNVTSANGAFTTAQYDTINNCTAEIGHIDMVLENPDRLTAYQEYRVVEVNCGSIAVMQEEDETKLYAVARVDGLKHKISVANLDSDDALESILAVSGTQTCVNKYCGTLQGIQFIDFQTGEIDQDYTVVHPWEVNKDRDSDSQLAEHQQGTLIDYKIRGDYSGDKSNIMARTETNTTVTTDTQVRGTQAVTHTIRLNDAPDKVVEQTWQGRSFNWSAPK